MKVITLKRICLTKIATYGVLIDDFETPFAVTLELPWKSNEQMTSCIPKGEYLCSQTVRVKHGLCYEVLQVPNREHILFHKGNNVWDSRGCILVGEQFEDTLTPEGKLVTSILYSGKGFSELITRTSRDKQFKLVIVETA